MAVSVEGVISIVVFYLLILLIGLWAGRKKTAGNQNEEEDIMVAGRNIGLIVGIFTMTATWVGGGYINGTAESTYLTGILWCQAPFGYAISLFLGGILFAKKMRQQGYVTMLDPFQEKYGQRMGGLLYLPAFCGEVLCASGILNALAASLTVIIDLDRTTSVLLSALVAVGYTVVGGLYSVAYTDVVQLVCMFIGLWLCVPYALLNPNTGSISSIDLMGTVENEDLGTYIDFALLLIFGGIPWQMYFQRVLSSKSPQAAQILSLVGGVGCFIMAIPSVLLGAAARVTDWNATEYNGDPAAQGDAGMILPLALKHLTPQWVTFIGLGAISAAVMSSADSCILSAASMFARNIYKNIFRQKASEREIIFAMRAAIIVCGAVACTLALTISSIYAVFALSSDLVYVLLFPQLLVIVHFNQYCNTYGSLASFVIALILRVGGGEKVLGLPALIKYPGYDEVKQVQLFPFRTLCMLVCLLTLVIVSKAAEILFKRGLVNKKYDYFKCFSHRDVNPSKNIDETSKL